MAYYYKINESKDILPPYKGFHLQKVKELKTPEPNISYDFTKHVLVELLDDATPEVELWKEMGLTDNKNIVHKRIMVDPHRIKCRRAIIICVSPDEAKQLAQRLSQAKVMNRCVCAIVIQDLLSDLSLFEKEIVKFGDGRSQHQFLYVSDLSRSRGPSGLTKFLKEKFSPFGTILSVLVCSDDKDYAYPEGVIKFAYLSEAFAAELAFDQVVVGKERLSVTTHHNILLSQCDLRVRLREAQWCCNVENRDFSGSYLDHSYKLNSLSTVNETTESSVNNLHVSRMNNSKNNDFDSIYSGLDDTLPAFSQYNLPRKFEMNDIEKTVTKTNCNKEKNLSSIISSVHKNSSRNTRSVRNKNATIIDSSLQQSAVDASETVPIDMSATKIIEDKVRNSVSETVLLDLDMSATKIIDWVDKSQNCKFRSRKNIALDSFLSTGKSSKNQSDTGSFVTCDSLEPNSKAMFLSPKKSSYRSFNSRHANSASEIPSQSSNCKHLSTLLEEKGNDSEVLKESLHKHSKKRKKKYTPSKKLCLKSQRTGLSQNSVLNASSQVSESGSSQQQCSQNHKGVADWLSRLPTSIDDGECSSKKEIETLDHKDVTCTQSSKVSEWLLNLPTVTINSSDVVEELSDLSPHSHTGKKIHAKNKVEALSENVFMEKAKSCGNKISALKSNIAQTNNDSIENEDPNIMTLISSSDQTDSIPLTDEYKSPLQMWLKQELLSSINNNAFESKEPSKSVIICATKTGNNFISVGCSYMTCDTCYPESTELLLGYS